jgi:hypothetical protein
MWQSNDAGDFDRVVDDGAQLLNDAVESEAGTTAWQKVRDSAASDDVQILLSDLLAGGIEAVFGWLAGR